MSSAQGIPPTYGPGGEGHNCILRFLKWIMFICSNFTPNFLMGICWKQQWWIQIWAQKRWEVGLASFEVSFCLPKFCFGMFSAFFFWGDRGDPPDRFPRNMLEEQMETARKEKTSLSLMQSSETDARPTGHPGRKMVFWNITWHRCVELFGVHEEDFFGMSRNLKQHNTFPKRRQNHPSVFSRAGHVCLSKNVLLIFRFHQISWSDRRETQDAQTGYPCPCPSWFGDCHLGIRWVPGLSGNGMVVELGKHFIFLDIGCIAWLNTWWYLSSTVSYMCSPCKFCKCITFNTYRTYVSSPFYWF